MCGRYASSRSSDDLSAYYGAGDETDGDLVPAWNIAPTDPVPAVVVDPAPPGSDDRPPAEARPAPSREAPGESGRPAGRETSRRELRMLRWGLVPVWAAAPRPADAARAGRDERRLAARQINARAETVAVKPAFRRAFARRRCLLPADGWYEWSDGRPYFITSADGQPVTLAGLWEPTGTCAIVTTAAGPDTAHLHSRTPVLLLPDEWESWLTGGDPKRLLVAPPPGLLTSWPVDRAVGNVRTDGPQLATPVVPAVRPAVLF